MAKTPAWQRKAGKNPKGGLNAKGRASAKKQGMNLKRPVKSGDNPRRASFLARVGLKRKTGNLLDCFYPSERGVQAVKLTLKAKRRQSPSETKQRRGKHNANGQRDLWFSKRQTSKESNGWKRPNRKTKDIAESNATANHES